MLQDLAALAARNQVFVSCIGMGYAGTFTPPVILRNVLENPGWYTQYTPYQAEISQGRLEALLAFQTMVADLTGLPLANASLLDEATAAAEAMAMCYAVAGGSKAAARAFFVAQDCHPQTIAVVQSRAEALGVEIVIGGAADLAGTEKLCGALLQYPGTDGRIADLGPGIEHLHARGALAVVATDLLALVLLTPPGELGADIAVGSSQRFGMPMGFGGPHAAFLATREQHVRRLPGRIVGVSRDASGKPGYRLTLQTREQHIRRESATSNICTAQALPAIVAAMYAVYHGPEGLRRIALHVHGLTCALAAGLVRLGHDVGPHPFFDTLHVQLGAGNARKLRVEAEARRINLRYFDYGSVGISLDETSTHRTVAEILAAFARAAGAPEPRDDVDAPAGGAGVIPTALQRTSPFLTHPVFQRYHSETEMLRYLMRLQARDLSLTTSMIPLGSCTMKLNATTEMLPMTWPGFAHLHPFAPAAQTQGYAELFRRLERQLGATSASFRRRRTAPTRRAPSSPATGSSTSPATGRATSTSTTCAPRSARAATAWARSW
jgi:glycine dehydrogenase